MTRVEEQSLLNDIALMKCELRLIIGRIDSDAEADRKRLLKRVEETEKLLMGRA